MSSDTRPLEAEIRALKGGHITLTHSVSREDLMNLRHIIIPRFPYTSIVGDFEKCLTDLLSFTNLVKAKGEFRLDGWCEGGLGQQRDDSGGCASMRERSERVESPGTYVTE